MIESNDNTENQIVTPGQPLRISRETINHAAHALFILWLKIAATLVVAVFVVHIWTVIVLMIVTGMLVATLNPLVHLLQKWVRRAFAITVIVFTIVLTLGGLFVLMIPPLMRQVHSLIIGLPKYLTQVEAATRKMGIPLHLHGSKLDLTQQAAVVGPDTFNALFTVFGAISTVITVAILTTYLLIDGSKVAMGALGILPRHQRLPVRQMFGEIGVKVGDYMRGQMITSGLAGLFSYIFLLILKVPEPLPLAGLMAVADLIPMIGPLIAIVPAALMALTIGTRQAMIVVIGYVIYHQLESHILVPRIYGTTMKISASVILFSILIGATLMGILGALLALPVAAAIPVIYRYVVEWREREDARSGTDDRVLP
ncbi:MAG: AI-2E family transporter [Chthonomonadales bacterium]